METKRTSGTIDGFMWYCENCGEKLYEEHLELKDIVSQFPPLMNRFFDNDRHRTCNNCGVIMSTPRED